MGCSTSLGTDFKFPSVGDYLVVDQSFALYNSQDPNIYDSYLTEDFTLVHVISGTTGTGGSSSGSFTNASSDTGSVASLPFFQKLANIFVVAVPLAPINDSQVCTLD